MSVKELSMKTGLPRQTVRFIKENYFLAPEFKPKTPDSEDKTGAPSTPASELAFLVKKCKTLVLDLKPDSRDDYEKAEKLTNLIMARFSFDEIAKMLADPELIPATVDKHISCESEAHPNLCAILRKLDSNQIHDAFELGEKSGENLRLPEDMRPVASDLQKKCGEISSLLNSTKLPFLFANISLIPAIILVTGLPVYFFVKFSIGAGILSLIIGAAFAVLRLMLLSYVNKKTEAAVKLSASLSSMLAGFEFNMDLCTLKLPSYFSSNYLNYNSPASAASDYADEIMSKGEIYSERARSVNALLDKISFVQ